MKSEDLLRYIGQVDDRFIDEMFEESPATTVKGFTRIKGLRTIAASLAVVIAGTAAMLAGLGGVDSGIANIAEHIKQLPMAANTVVMLDVNPSVVIEVNDRNVVVDVEALNKDAEKVTADIDVVGKKYESAVKITVAAMQEKGYITNLKNSVLVTVMDKDDARADEVRKDVVKAIGKINKKVDYGISVLSQIMTSDKDYKELAEDYNVSSGRILLLDKICKADSDMSIEALVKNNIQTINQLLVYTGIPETVERVGEAAGVIPKEYRESVNLDELNSDELVKFTKAVSDFYNKLTEYYSESDVAKEIGYVLNVAEGVNASGDKLWGIIAESRNQLVGSKGAIINIGDDVIHNLYDQKNINKVTQFITGVIKNAA